MPKALQTPPTLPEEIQCRTLKIPSDKYWLGVFNSALLEMVNPYNWEQVNDTDLTIDETIALIQPMIQEYWDTEGCGIGESCLQPDGLRVVRLDENGHFQELADGVWQEPTGDYAIPSTPARSEDTPYSRRCAAAANAANVLKLIYEEVTDAIADDLSDAEILELMLLITIALVGTAIGALAAAIIGLAAFLLKLFIDVARFIGLDVWDSEFDALLQCALFECADDSADVVTFNFECVAEQIANAVDLTDETALDQLKLFGQVQYMLSIIGADGLNLAGATTAITDANCDLCGGWCYYWDFTVDNGGWTLGEAGVYTSGIGWQTTYFASGGSGYRFVDIRRAFSTANVTGFEVAYTLAPAGVNQGGLNIMYKDTSAVPNRMHTWALQPTGSYTENGYFDITDNNVGIVIYAGFRATPSTDPGGQCTITSIALRGTGINPFGDTNCEP